MLLEFTHENANQVLSLFNEGNIAHLDIKAVTVDNKRRFVFNYTTMDSLDTHNRSVAMKTLNNPNTYTVRMRVTEMLNKFIENMATDTVVRFALEFSVVDRTTPFLSTQVQFAKEVNTVTDKCIADCLKELDSVVTKMGIAPVKVDGVFKRESGNKGRKHSAMTVAEIVSALRSVLVVE